MLSTCVYSQRFLPVRVLAPILAIAGEIKTLDSHVFITCNAQSSFSIPAKKGIEGRAIWTPTAYPAAGHIADRNGFSMDGDKPTKFPVPHTHGTLRR
jgi:hypothetical protein